MKLHDYLETDLNFYKKVASVAIPVTAQNLITIGVNMMDTIMLGSLGEIALSASSLANQFISLFQIFCMGLGMGASVLTSRYFGAKDNRSLKMVITVAWRFCLGLAVLFTVAAALAPETILRLYSNEADVIANGAIYLRWSLPTFVMGGMALVTTNIMRSINLTKVPLVTSVMAFFINVGANWVFIYGKLGAPVMGVAGAALGTVIARVFEFSCICGYFVFVDKTIRYRLRDFFGRCRGVLGEYIKTSLPVLISDGLLGLGNNAVAMVIGRMGAQFVSANAITTVVQQTSTVFVQGVSFSATIITGQTLGQGRIRDAERQGYTFFALGTALGLVACSIIMLIKTPVINAYNITPETTAIAHQLMNAIGLIIVFQAMNSILTKGVLRGGGDTRFLMVADILFLWVVSIPLGACAGLVWGLQPFWVYGALKADQVIKAIWCVFRLRSGKWIKKIEGAKE